jgi:hypothetical protein
MSDTITNYSTAIFLFNNKARAIMAIYEAAPTLPGQPTPKKTMYKTLDPDIKVDDFVLVPTDTRHNMTVVKVTDINVEIDLESPTKIAWVIGPIDRQDYEQVLQMEANAINAIKSAQTTKKRKALRETLMADIPVDEIKALPIAAFNGGDQPKS